MRSANIRDRARQSAGEPSVTRGQFVDIGTEITALEKRDIQELRAEWRKVYRAEPPRRLSRDLVADKGYHSRALLKTLDGGVWKTRIAEPKQPGFSRWRGDD